MPRTYKKLEFRPKTYLSNPSVSELTTTTKHKKTYLQNGNKALIVDSETGEHIGQMGAAFLEEKTVDTEQFIKLYVAGINELMSLTGAGIKVFRLVYDLMLENPNTDFFTLDYKTLKFREKWKYSQPTFNTGLNELLSKFIIYKSIAPAQYFINIALFYNGDRLTLIKSYKLSNKNNSKNLLASHDVDVN